MKWGHQMPHQTMGNEKSWCTVLLAIMSDNQKVQVSYSNGRQCQRSKISCWHQDKVEGEKRFVQYWAEDWKHANTREF